MYKYRELQRIMMELEYLQFDFDKSVEIKDRLDILNEAFIFYPKRFWDALKGSLYYTFTGRCRQCGNRHIKKIDKKYKNGGSFYCSLGWWKSLLVSPRAIWFYSQNGDD